MTEIVDGWRGMMETVAGVRHVSDTSRSSVARLVSSPDYEQEVATIFTSSTFSFGALDEDAEVAADDELDDELDCSTVPVISTLWPT